MKPKFTVEAEVDMKELTTRLVVTEMLAMRFYRLEGFAAKQPSAVSKTSLGRGDC